MTTLYGTVLERCPDCGDLNLDPRDGTCGNCDPDK